MLSSTVARAAAATTYPAPFVTGGTADVAVVYGELAALSDVTAARKVSTALGASQLAAATSVTTPATTSGEGDQLTLDRPSTKLHLGNTTYTAFSRAVTDQDLPTLLADGTYLNADGDEYDYTQKVDINPAIQVTQFSDSDYQDSEPEIGARIASGNEVLNYTLDFSENPKFTDTLESTDITLMGKSYYILQQVNTSGSESLTLLDSATSVVVSEGETKQVTLDGKTYSIAVDVSTSTVKVTVNGKTSTSLSAGGTFKVGGGVYVGVKDISYKSKESAVSNAEISIGTGKLVLTHGLEVEMNEDSVANLYAYFTQTSEKLDKVKIQWKVDEDSFITPNSSIEMPGFKALKLSSTGMVYPASEEVVVEADGSDTIQLKAPLTDGDATVDLLSLNATDVYGVIGKDSSNVLRTGTASITFDGDTDEMFPVGWTNGKDFESYLLRATSFAKDSSGVNTTTIQRMKDGSWTDVQKEVTEADHVIIGNIDMTVGDIIKDDKTIAITTSGADFHTLYTAKGLKIMLPWNNVTVTGTTTTGAINISENPTAFNLIFVEADVNGNIASGNSFYLPLTRVDTNTKVSVSAPVASTGSVLSTAYEVADSELYVTQVYSPLASTIKHDQEPTQQDAVITYHGEESYFKLLLTASSVSVGSGGGTVGGDLFVTDAEMAKFQDKNLIVIGGSCINKVAAKVLGSDTPVCGADFTTKSGVKAGEYLVKTYQSPYNTAKVATLVAGYEAAETTNAADFLLTQSVDTTVGAEYPNGVKKTVSPTA
jgi:hypothetical protein